MVEITAWMEGFLQQLQQTFDQRVWFVGLQGSYGRGEATAESDIDVVVILDELTGEDIRCYRQMLDTLPHRERICGFLSGTEQLLHWEPSDLFQFYHDTTPIKGSLDALLPLLDGPAVDRAIKIGVCNLFHGCVHNMLHGRSDQALRDLYKSASFVVQAIAFRQTGSYFRCRQELRLALCPDEQVILDTFWQLKNGEAVRLDEMSETLVTWCQCWIGKI